MIHAQQLSFQLVILHVHLVQATLRGLHAFKLPTARKKKCIIYLQAQQGGAEAPEVEGVVLQQTG